MEIKDFIVQNSLFFLFAHTNLVNSAFMKKIPSPPGVSF